MIRRRTAAFVATGAFIAISALALYDAGFLGVQQMVASNAQYIPWDTEFVTKASVMVFEGKVKSTEIKTVYEPPETEDGKIIFESRDRPYNYLTIRVTEWLKDSTEQYPDHVVVRDHAKGALGKIGGEPVWFTYGDATDYAPDERGIFFVTMLEGELATEGASMVFRYDDNGMVYLPYTADIENPLDPVELKAKVRALE